MAAKCSACNQIFTASTPFDMHRTGKFGDPIYEGTRIVGYTPHTRRCLTEEEMLAKGMVRNERGAWTSGKEYSGNAPDCDH